MKANLNNLITHQGTQRGVQSWLAVNASMSSSLKDEENANSELESFSDSAGMSVIGHSR
jgi:hypothetical protein